MLKAHVKNFCSVLPREFTPSQLLITFTVNITWGTYQTRRWGVDKELWVSKTSFESHCRWSFSKLSNSITSDITMRNFNVKRKLISWINTWWVACKAILKFVEHHQEDYVSKALSKRKMRFNRSTATKIKFHGS